MRLTADTDDAVLSRLSEPERQTEARRRELERLATFCSPRDVDVEVRLSRTGSFCQTADGDADYEVTVSSRKHEQYGTSWPAAVWDRELQVALLFHELGHVRYSGFAALEDHLSALDARWRSLFRSVYNAAEDGVIETQVAAEFRLHDELRRLNEALTAENRARHRDYVDLFTPETDAETPLTYTVYEALVRGLLDNGFYDSGTFARICDPDDDRRVVRGGRRDVVVDLRSSVEAYMEEMLAEPEPTARVERARAFFETVKATFTNLPPLQRTRVQTSPVRPADAAGYDEWRPTRADRLQGSTAGRRRSAASGAGGESAEEPLGSADPEEIRRAARGTAVRSETRRVTSAYERAAEELLALVREEDDCDEIHVVEPIETPDRERWTAATRDARRLRADLGSRLRRERRPRRTPRERVGRLNSQRLVAATQGTQRVFTRQTDGTEKDYSCVVLLDRSRSMSGPEIEAAEAGLAQLSGALFDVGVDVSVLSLWREHVCLELPFGADPSENVDRLLTERASGSTPLADGLRVARHRLTAGAGAVPFVVVITDGRPNSTLAYKKELERCSAPVYGVYIGDRRGHASYFDQLIDTGLEGVDTALRDLARRLFRGGA